MDLELHPELQKFIQERVNAGEYASGRDVVEAGIARLMLDPTIELDDETIAALDEGKAQLDRGEGHPWHEVKAKLLRIVKEQKTVRVITVRHGARRQPRNL